MPARDALHYQVQMKEELNSPGSLMAMMLDGFDRSQRGMPAPPGAPDALSNPIGLFAPPGRGGVPYRDGRLAEIFRNVLAVAYPFYVEPHMTPVVTAAAESMPHEVLRPEDLPAQQGFLLLPDGLMSVDIRGQMLVHNALLWSVRGGGVDMYWLTNKYDERDSINLRMRAEFGDDFTAIPLLGLGIYNRLEFGEPPPLSLGAKKVLPPEISQHVRLVRDAKSNAISWSWPEGYDLGEWMREAASPHPDTTSMWMMALWRMMQQTLTDIREEPVDRPLRKQARRVQMQQNAVVVIKLRKRKGAEGDGTFEYSHRFWRRGHWRNQWYGPRNGGPDERYQRAIYIHPVLVNAEHEDLPLLARERVYSLSR